MITKPNEVSIAVKRVTSRVSDGAGGYTLTETAITGSPFLGRLVRKATASSEGLQQAEQGDILRDKVVLVFPAGSDIRAGDTCTVSSVEYTVQLARSYSRSVQADVLAVV